MQSKAATPAEYLKALPEERRETVKKLRSLIRKHLPKGYREAMRFGFITYEVPLKICPDTYNGEPLMYAAIASQKRHYGIYLMGVYIVPELHKRLVTEWKSRGKRLDMGKSCIRVSSWENCEHDLIAEAVAALPMKKFIQISQAAHSKRK